MADKENKYTNKENVFGKKYEINSKEYDGKEHYVIKFKDGKEMPMFEVEDLLFKYKTAEEPLAGRETSKRISKFLEDKNPTKKEFIQYFSEIELNKGGTPTKGLMGKTADFLKKLDYGELAAESLPIAGETAAIKRASDAFREKDYLGAGIETAAGALGVVPVVGDLAGKALRTATKKFRNVKPLEIGSSELFQSGKLLKNYTPLNTKQILKKVNKATAGSKEANKLINAPLTEGTKVGVRLNLNSTIPDMPKGLDKLQTLHKNNYNGKALSYKGFATVENVTFNVSQKGRQGIAANIKKLDVPEAKSKFPAMSVDGNYNSTRNVLEEIDDTVVEIGFNPASGHLFVDMSTGQAVKGADVATVVGDRVFAKGVTYIKKADAPKPLNATDGTILPSEVRYRMNKGGAVTMNKQMKLFEEGGLNQEGGMIDAESGNEVPVGSTREEVRDDIPAKLSEGEFVMPADVVRYHGLDKMMALRDEAKMGLRKMEAMGQMGNSDEATLPEEMPFSMADLIVVAEDGKEVEMAEGGYVTMANGGDPSASVRQLGPTYTPPISQPIDFKKVMGDANISFKEYRNADGKNILVAFIGGKPIYPIPEGYSEYTPITGEPISPVQEVVEASPPLPQEDEGARDRFGNRYDGSYQLDMSTATNAQLAEETKRQNSISAKAASGIAFLVGGPAVSALYESGKSISANKLTAELERRLENGLIDPANAAQVRADIAALKDNYGYGIAGNLVKYANKGVDALSEFLGINLKDKPLVQNVLNALSGGANPNSLQADFTANKGQITRGPDGLDSRVTDYIADRRRRQPEFDRMSRINDVQGRGPTNFYRQLEQSQGTDAQAVAPANEFVDSLPQVDVTPAGGGGGMSQKDANRANLYVDTAFRDDVKGSDVGLAQAREGIQGQTIRMLNEDPSRYRMRDPRFSTADQQRVGEESGLADMTAAESIAYNKKLQDARESLPSASQSQVNMTNLSNQQQVGLSNLMPITPARDVQGFLDAGNQMNLIPTADPRGPSQIPPSTTPFPIIGTQPVGTKMGANVAGTSGRQNVYRRDIFPPVSGGSRDEIVTDAAASIYGPDVKLYPAADYTSSNLYGTGTRVPSVGQEEFSALRRTDSGVRDVPSFGDTDPILEYDDPEELRDAATYRDPRGPSQIPSTRTPFPSQTDVSAPSAAGEFVGSLPTTNKLIPTPADDAGMGAAIQDQQRRRESTFGQMTTPKLDPSSIPLRGADVIGTTSKTADQMGRINEPLASGLSAPSAPAVAARPTTVDYRDARDKGNLVSGVPLTARGNKTYGGDRVYDISVGNNTGDSFGRAQLNNDIKFAAATGKAPPVYILSSGREVPADSAIAADDRDNIQTGYTGTDAEKNVIGKISGVDGLAGVVRKSADSNKAAKADGKTVYKDSSGKAYTRSTFGNKVEVEFKNGNWSNKTDAKGEPVKYSKGKGVTSGHGTKSEQDNSDEKEDSKIICTAMNASYGFGSYRQAIWLNYSNKHLTKAHEVGYHTLFLPLVHLAYTKNNKFIRKILEHGTRRRTADLRAELKGTKRNTLGRIYRSIFEPLCYGVGKIKMAFGE